MGEIMGEIMDKIMDKIIIVEDDKGLNQGLCMALREEGRQIISCMDLKSAREQLASNDAALVLLDINLPDGNGFDLLRLIRETMPALPVILLTANDTDMDVVNGLEQGADDYITKPFSLAVLRARVNTQLKRGTRSEMNCNTVKSIIKIDDYEFDFDRMRFSIGETAVELSKTEQRLLRLLIDNRGNVMGRGDLVDRIWTDGGSYVDENALSIAVKRLRDKLKAQNYIKTIYGIGYSWVKEHD